MVLCRLGSLRGRMEAVLAIVVRCGDETLRFRVPSERARLGSDPQSDLVVRFNGVSRSHAVLEPLPAGLRVADAGSKNGLSFCGRRVPECELGKGDVVRLGLAWLSLEECDTGDLEPGVLVPGDTRAPRPLRKATATSSVEAGSKSGSSRSVVLRLVREVDRLGPVAGSGDARVEPLLGLAREVLGASTVALFRQGGGEGVTPLVVAGVALAPAEIRSIARAGSPGGAGCDGAPIRVRRDPGTGLGILVTFPPGADPPSWWVELFDFLASSLLGLPSAGAGAVLAGGAPDSRLAVPAGMVPGRSPAMQGLLSQIAATVRSRLDVLLLGETGTGKELFARLIHASGPTPGGPFVAINCAAIPSELLEAELFGVHGRVATGVDPRIGRIQQAEGGTVFLDEVGELAEPLQAKLLRFLQEREIAPLGAPTPRRVSVRVVSASNRDVPALVAAGRFRADLFFRLSGLQFHIPPLRDRREDIPDLVASIVQGASTDEGRDVRGVSRSALKLLVRYDWPGNVRELENELRRAVLVCPEGSLIQAEHLGRLRWAVGALSRPQTEPGSKHAPSGAAAAAGETSDSAAPAPAAFPAEVAAEAPPDLRLRDRIRALERVLVVDALRQAGGNKTRAAALLGITRPGLIKMLRRLEPARGNPQGRAGDAE